MSYWFNHTQAPTDMTHVRCYICLAF